MHRSICFLFVLAFAAPSGHCDVRLARIFGDHMVLQRSASVPIWGWADPGEEIVVTPSWASGGANSSGQVRAVATAAGEWRVRLSTPPAGGPHAISVQGQSSGVLLKDILAGEVWICSGQSNMQWTVSQGADAAFEGRAANHPRIRFFQAKQSFAMEPAADISGSWSVCSPATAPGFSAVSYYFGRELQAKLGVPIGLVSTNWGGTVIEAWTSREALTEAGEFSDPLSRLSSAIQSAEPAASLASLQGGWWKNLEATDPGFVGSWMSLAPGEGGWEDAKVPANFSSLGLGGFDGCVWFLHTMEVDAALASGACVLDLGPVDDMDVTFVNGKRVGSTTAMGKYLEPRSYPLPVGTLRAGHNTIAVCAVDTGGAGTLGVGGGKNHEMRLRAADSGPGEGVRLEGTWMVRKGASMSTLGEFPVDNWFHRNYPTALYNAMIAPIIPFAMRGAIWYQGESNRTRAVQYRTLFPAMIRDWRRRWTQSDFPFYFVQIAPYNYGNDTGQAAELREAQAMALTLANTGMAVTMDIGNPKDIHPVNKQDVGARLARWALARDYGADIVPSGPLYRSMVVVGDTARLHFAYAEGGLTALGGSPTHFTIAGEDRVFHAADARIDGETVLVSSPDVPHPRAVRFAWGAADEPNLKNASGLPAPSFRTDDWPALTAPK